MIRKTRSYKQRLVRARRIHDIKCLAGLAGLGALFTFAFYIGWIA